MSPSEKLTAAAERIAQRVGDVRPVAPLPWAAKDEDTVEDAARFTVGHMATPVEADLIVTAANVMPDLAEWLREMASEVDNLGTGDGHEAHGQDPWTDLCRAALAVADQILGGER